MYMSVLSYDWQSVLDFSKLET